MLRLPLTSIGLSEKDVAYHIQQIDIYHGLLKQGFKKTDILRYMNDHNQAKHERPSNDFDNLSVASTVDLALLNSGHTVAHVSPPPSSDAKSGPPPYESEVAENRQSSPPEPSHPDASRETFRRHAPRQSSLLRFTELASPAASDDTNDIAQAFNRSSPRTYRPRTETYSYNQSEISESDLVRVKAAHHDEPAISPTRSPMRADARAFVPSGDVDLEEVHQILAQASSIRSRRQRAEVEAFSIHQDSDAGYTPPSSPPAASSESSLLPIVLSTPGHSRNAPRGRATPRSQQLDGHFSVYNDALPSLSQPQTPLDLERQPRVSFRDAAYTAPPGMVHVTTRSPRHRSSVDDEAGARSPTARAMDTRERRARELRRGIRVQTARLDGLRLNDDTEDTPRAGPRQSSGSNADDAWRNNLEGDRVGDENWEIETVVRDGFENGIRIVSGNARHGG